MRLLIIFFISALSVVKANNTAEMISSANWPLFALNSQYNNSIANFIEFEETDFVELVRQAQQSHETIIPMLKTRSYTKHLLLNYPEIKWRYSMGFSAGDVSGFSQSIGMSTALIKDELFFSADVAHVNYSFSNHSNRHFNGEKYHVGTSLDWFPTENFSLHLGLATWVNK